MSTRLDRYLVVAQLANLILEGQPHHDEFRIEQAAQDLRDAVAAGRRDQDRFAAEVQKLATRMQNDEFSRRADLPHLRVVADIPDVTEPEFRLLAYPEGRDEK